MKVDPSTTEKPINVSLNQKRNKIKERNVYERKTKTNEINQKCAKKGKSNDVMEIILYDYHQNYTKV